MATNVSVTVTVYDEDGAPVSGATVKVIDTTPAVLDSGTTDASGVYTATISTSVQLPATWRAVARKTGYYKGGGFLIFTDATTAVQTFYLNEDVG